MLMLQSGFKSDLENNRMVFVLFMSNEEKIFNCSVEYNVIKDAKDGEQLANALMPMVRNLANALMADEAATTEDAPATEPDEEATEAAA